MIPHKNRVPSREGRVDLVPIEGETNKYTLTRADEPLEAGTPINKELLDEFLAASGVTTGTEAALELAQDGYQLGDGYAVRFKLNTDISDSYGTTLNINGTGAKPLKASGGYPFGTITAGTWVNAIYDAVEDAYIMSGSAEIVNYPIGEIDKADYLPFFDASENKSARVLLSELLKITTKAVGIKNEIARFTSSGTWTCPDDVTEVDVWIVGGGGGGGKGNVGGGGGGGGYCRLRRKIAVTPGKQYNIVIGAGGTSGNSGGNSSAFGYTANGGKTGTSTVGGAGGNGGGGSGGSSSGGVFPGGNGGSRGSSGSPGNYLGGQGSASLGAEYSTTNPYDGIDYAGGGGGASYELIGGTGGGSFGGRAEENGGNGGGFKNSDDSGDYAGGGGSYGGGGPGLASGSSTYVGGTGGSGIVIIYG